MINATLCTTNGEEPWAANVDFETNGSKWAVNLNAKYAHYKNIARNNNVVVVYKTPTFEIIAKGIASLAEPTSDDASLATITLTWLRLVENGNVSDHTETSEIEHAVSSHI